MVGIRDRRNYASEHFASVLGSYTQQDQANIAVQVACRP